MSRERYAITPEQRAELLNMPCAYCGSGWGSQEIDHIVPWSRTHDGSIGNLAPACYYCNREKRDFTPDEWRDWRVKTGRSWPPPKAWVIISQVMAHFDAGVLPPGNPKWIPYHDEQAEIIHRIVLDARSATSREPFDPALWGGRLTALTADLVRRSEVDRSVMESGIRNYEQATGKPYDPTARRQELLAKLRDLESRREQLESMIDDLTEGELAAGRIANAKRQAELRAELSTLGGDAVS